MAATSIHEIDLVVERLTHLFPSTQRADVERVVVRQWKRLGTMDDRSRAVTAEWLSRADLWDRRDRDRASAHTG